MGKKERNLQREWKRKTRKEKLVELLATKESEKGILEEMLEGIKEGFLSEKQLLSNPSSTLIDLTEKLESRSSTTWFKTSATNFTLGQLIFFGNTNPGFDYLFLLLLKDKTWVAIANECKSSNQIPLLEDALNKLFNFFKVFKLIDKLKTKQGETPEKASEGVPVDMWS